MASPALSVLITGRNDLDKVIAQSTKQLASFRRQSERTQNELRRMTDVRGVKDLNKAFQDTTRSSFDFFKNISRSVDSLGVLTGSGSIAGLAALSHSIADIGQGQLNAARGLNVSVKTLSTWQNAAQAAGASVDGVTSSFGGLERAVTQMKLKGSPAMGEANMVLGDGWQNKYKTDVQILMGISKKVSSLHGQNLAEAVAGAQSAFGLSPDFVRDFLMRGPAYVQAALDKASQHSMNDQQAGKLDGLASSFTSLGQSITQAGTDAVASIAPQLIPALNGLSGWIDSHQKTFDAFAVTLGAIGTGLGFKVAKSVLGRGKGVPEAGAPGAGAAAEASPSLWSRLLPLGAGVSDLALGAASAALIGLWPETPGKDDLGLGRRQMKGMASNAAYLTAAMRAQGAPNSFIAAALGNAAWESGLDPSRAQAGGGPGYGLFQWEAARQKLFKQVEGVDIHGSGITQQTDFFLREMQNRYPKDYATLMSGKLDDAQATKLFMQDYEAPRDRNDMQGSILNRTAYAEQFDAGLGGELHVIIHAASGTKVTTRQKNAPKVKVVTAMPGAS